jgi:hypothetical protein
MGVRRICPKAPTTGRELPRDSGWYRLTDAGWVQVPAADAEAEAAAGDGWDLVYVHIDAADVPLW